MTAYDLATVAAGAATRTAALTAIAAERAEREARWQADRLAAADAARRSVAAIRDELEALDGDGRAAAAAAAARAAVEPRLKRVAQAATAMRQRVRERLEARLSAVRAAADAAARARAAQGAGQRAEAGRAAVGLRQRVQSLDATARTVMRRYGAAVPGEAPPAGELPAGADALRIVAQLDAQIGQLESLAGRAAGSWSGRLGGPLGRTGLHLAALLPGGAAFAADATAGGLPLALTLLAVAQGAAWAGGAVARRAAAGRATALAGAVADADRRLAALEAACAAQAGARAAPRLDAVLREGALSEDQQREARAEAEAALNEIKRREAELRARVARIAAGREAEARSGAGSAVAAEAAAIRARLAEAEGAAGRRTAELDAAWQRERSRLDAARQAAESAAAEAWGSGAALCAGEHPPWEDQRWAVWNPAAAWPTGLPLGRIEAPDGGPALPAALPYPVAASAVLRCGPERRGEVLGCLSAALLRALAATPPGRLKIHLVDPVGLGQSFAPLLGLADLGEAVLPGGVATDDARIERTLEDLCAHVEAVIRTRLRGRFETVVDYNRTAGELQEPIRLLAVADFPSGFGERAQERLAVLLRTGARCGVHVLLHHDARTRPSAAAEAALAQHATAAIRESDGALRVQAAGLDGWTFRPEAPPPPAESARLAAAAGAAAVRASRVELSFSQIVPDAAGFWSQSTAATLRVPIGMAGAGKVQHLELGRGTAQHVLIGGRTGSGKSTLLHVLVTSAALWHHPRELEVHLIDFKKGVEFQAYAALKLPHARVIAVESDREFGLSVLRRLDAELVRRGELFRAAGAQDLASHRRAGGEHLPRVLLLIDEFQEFFTEDDTVARDAALLLDRFVRQGRAFGLHVVLGSQTLAGSYSLAKSSLGQMGVRIVLPCNEADAHLLLHEDNDAVRLLTRPGEAIYNDQAGLADGNSPFQVCWLSDETRAGHLREVAARCAADGWTPSSPTVVFAGDAPARFDEDAGFAALIARPLAAGEVRTAAWIGQSSSLRGAAEVAFPAASGGNLLLVGQHREGAHATLAALVMGLAARHPVDGLRLLCIDGEEAEGPFAGVLAALAQALPHPLRRSGAREAGDAVAEAAAILDRRAGGEDAARTPVVVVVNALQRVRALRPDDDAPFDRAGGEPPAERFARLIAQGPEHGVHIAAWCDSLAGVQRSLSRRSLRDFDLRILFQMSPADSSELIDDDAASRLGLHSALLAVLAEGRREKFRPWQVPAPAFIAAVGTALRARDS